MTLRTELAQARQLTDAIFSIVLPSSLYDRPIPLRHRIIFYVGHLEAFDFNLVCAPLGVNSSRFDRLFAFGIDPGAGNLPTDEPHVWPAVDEVRSYVSRARESFDAMLDDAPEQLVHVAIEHRLMHAETLAYILHNMPYDRKVAPLDHVETISEPRPPWSGHMVEIEPGTAELGRHPHEGFGWDNEFPAHEIAVDRFAIGKYKVTNGDYLRFVESGGTPPPFWTLRDGKWHYRGMFSEIPLPLDWPVYVTQQQAAAYAQANSRRLPTEAEFHRAAWCDHGASWTPDAEADNFDLRHWDPIPVTAGAENPNGVVQMVGNGWEWTSTPFVPFSGFIPFPFYPGYSADFFDGDHYVLKGASPRTAARLTRPSFRNWFRADYPYMYATFRVVQDVVTEPRP